MRFPQFGSRSAIVAVMLLLGVTHPLLGADLPVAEGAADGPDLSDTDLRDFRVNLLGLFNAGRYTELDALAQRLQQQRSRFAGGAWRLHVLFGTLSSPGSATATDAAWEAHIAKLEQWSHSSPASPTPLVWASTMRFRISGHAVSLAIAAANDRLDCGYPAQG